MGPREIVIKGDKGPGRRRGRQDKPSGTEVYGERVRGRGSLGSRSGVKRVKRDILTLGTENKCLRLFIKLEPSRSIDTCLHV